MDARLFDAITRTFRVGADRRRVLGVLLGGWQPCSGVAGLPRRRATATALTSARKSSRLVESAASVSARRHAAMRATCARPAEPIRPTSAPVTVVATTETQCLAAYALSTKTTAPSVHADV